MAGSSRDFDARLHEGAFSAQPRLASMTRLLALFLRCCPARETGRILRPREGGGQPGDAFDAAPEHEVPPRRF